LNTDDVFIGCNPVALQPGHLVQLHPSYTKSYIENIYSTDLIRTSIDAMTVYLVYNERGDRIAGLQGDTTKDGKGIRKLGKHIHRATGF
jgi:hypothetical protein